jgi:ParB-like chromosome segregation protein Spo0J
MTQTTIPFSSIDLGQRGRTQYSGIEELAESISHNGLIQPLVLVEQEVPAGPDVMDGIVSRYLLLAGGRRFHALQLLGVTELHHGVSSEPGRYGYVLKGEQGTELSNLLTEIAENCDRQDIPWQDNVRMIVKATRLLRRDAFANGHEIIMRDMGAILGVPYHDLRCAEALHDDLIANPGDYAACPSIRYAYTALLKKNEKVLKDQLVKRTLGVKVQDGPKPERKEGDANATGELNSSAVANVWETDVQSTIIPLSQRFFHTNGINWLHENPQSVDHVICDPDFAVSKERLEAGAVNSGDGVAQDSVEDSIADLLHFIVGAYSAIKPNGFLVFFCDLDHWNMLYRQTISVGFATQRWPFLWHKTDYRSNASPQSNMTKCFEYAMVCRKPGAVLATSPVMSLFAHPSASATKDFGHPFAKPRAVWNYLYNACCIKGQTVFDPFVGSGSAALSAIEFGLNPIGCEIQEQHYNTLILNLQREYKKLLGENVRFE